MDFSIWLPPENQDERTYPTNSWEYNQYFDPRLDVIEEDALNEKSCKEVLKILANQVDSEVVELEDDILSVQNRLTCEDYMDAAALNEKNVNLESMLRPSQNENQQIAEPGVGSSNLPEGLNKTVKCRDDCTVQANNTILPSLVEVENQQETTAKPGVGSSNLPEGFNKTIKFRDNCTVQANNTVLASPIEVENQHETTAEPGVGSSNLPEGLNETGKFRDDCTVQANSTVLASLVEVKNQQETPAEPGVGSSNLPEGLNESVKFRDNWTVQANNTVLASLVEVENQQETPAGTTLEDDRHASEQEINEDSSKSTQNEVKSVQINDPSGVKGKEVLHTEIDRTMEDTQPHLPNSIRNDRSTPDNYEDKTIKGTQQRAGIKRTGDSADITATPQRDLRKRSKKGFAAPVVKENNDQRNVQNVLVSSPGRTTQEPQILSNVNNVDVDLSKSSTTPVPHVASAPSSLSYIDHMSLVQLKALAHQHNIHGVSKTRKADLQQILRAKLQT